MGPVGASLLLRSEVLAALGVERSTVVWSIGEVDGHIDGFLRNEGPDLTAETERESALHPPELEMGEEPSGRAVGVSSTALSPGAVDGGPKDGRPEQQIGGVPHHGRAESPADGALQEREQPGQGRRADLPIRQGPRPPSRTVGR